ncbi:putative cytoplasmic protein [Thalassoporum mexicanum PCC 7367]|uniref:PmeII family type II restriction endonuclease n=1 Tax=Thalassoporum mexicanum TaxID=3457544 RepID=UPI00029F984F|nr:PmeII family type II restriction endonuclease [Pseudanabaena sp. PCC 7367]AFY69825.1 putative cytoplasmic protein [Pseudanabaena sp. PCC 7367]
MSLINPEELEKLIREKLDLFYTRRIQTLDGLDLWKTLKRKNPYLFRAFGVIEPSEIVKELLQAYVSSSDEGIFGGTFFEPIVHAVSGGVAADIVGIDAIVETATTYTVIQVKSGPNWGNADQKRKLKDNFQAARSNFLTKNIKKEFRALLGQCYGRTASNASDKRPYITQSGQAFWQELTGDPDFYLKLIRLMKDYPLRHRPDYQEAFSRAVTKLTHEFIEYFTTSDYSVDWDKIVRLNSGREQIKKPVKKKTKRRKT